MFGVEDEEKESAEESIHKLNATAVEELKDVLTTSESDDVRRKAAVDILNFSSVGKSKGRAPEVTEAQLDFLGRVIVEAEEVRKGLSLGEGPMAGTA